MEEMKAARLAPPPRKGQQAQEERRGQGGPFDSSLGAVAAAHWLAAFHPNAFHLGPRSSSCKYLVPGAVYKQSDPELPGHAATLM